MRGDARYVTLCHQRKPHPWELTLGCGFVKAEVLGWDLLGGRGARRHYKNERMSGRSRGGADPVLFAQPATDRPGIDLQQLRSA